MNTTFTHIYCPFCNGFDFFRVEMPSYEMICHKYDTYVASMWHFRAFNLGPALSSLKNTLSRLQSISSNDLPMIIIWSLRYTRHLSNCRPARTVFMKRWNVAIAQVRPKSITLNWNKPLRVTNAVLLLSSSFIAICKQTLLRSSIENKAYPDRWSNASSMFGRG